MSSATTAGQDLTAGLFSRPRITAGPGFSRWMVPPAALCVHLCIGQVYAFSGGDGGKQRANIRARRSAQSLKDGTIRIVIRRMHLDVGEKKTGTAFDHLFPQTGHQRGHEQQHGIAQADRRHRDQRPPGIPPEIAPGEPQEPNDHHGFCCAKKSGSENVPSLIGASKTMSS